MTERTWIIIAALLALAAGVLLWRNNMPAAFVTATLGAVAWFLSYRVQLRAKIDAAEQESNEQDTHEESVEK
jgi:F0F1-type ATP synthase assembly protein I